MIRVFEGIRSLWEEANKDLDSERQAAIEQVIHIRGERDLVLMQQKAVDEERVAIRDHRAVYMQETRTAREGRDKLREEKDRDYQMWQTEN